eukprot:CAMPEP_0168618192 /NCGR_PEP_ID=MMETSP0449_2-20121227/5944_1 /TAXON_ID=1082188 /ORGANISM="Strombidium rassoulzadegani, Strain ras09" /LENGTH=85 /DNA_ID=CAMNT_0008659057 /DNA_START=215 /DNA_END=472 /DNA_ORIENTATION=-
MARAQAQELLENLQQLFKNIKEENAKIKHEKDQKKVTAFFKKVGVLVNQVPVVQALWTKLGLSAKEAEPVFNQILTSLKAIIDEA